MGFMEDEAFEEAKRMAEEAKANIEGEGNPLPSGENTPPATPPETPPATPPETPPATPPITSEEKDYSPFLQEFFGDKFKSVEELKEANILSNLERLSELENENKSLKEQKEPLKYSFANEVAAKFDNFSKETGIDDIGIFGRLLNADIENMDPIDLLALKQEIDNKNMRGRTSDIKEYLKSQYKIDPDKYEEHEVKLNKIGLESEAHKASETLLSLKEKMVLPQAPNLDAENKAKQEKLEQEQKTLSEGWKNVTEKLLDGFKTVPLSNGESTPLMNYEVTSEQREVLKKEAYEFLVNNKYPLNEASLKSAATFVQNRFFVENKESILKAYGEKVRAMTDDEWDKAIHNPSKVANSDVKPEVKKPISSLEESSAAALRLELS